MGSSVRLPALTRGYFCGLRHLRTIVSIHSVALTWLRHHHTIIWATFVRLFVCLFPYSSEVLRPIIGKLGAQMKLHPRIALEGFIFGKVNVIWVKGQMSVLRGPLLLRGLWRRSFGRFPPNLAGGWSFTPELPLTGLFFERPRSLGPKVKCLFFRDPLLLRAPLANFRQTWWADEASPQNCTCVFLKVKVIGVKGQMSVL